MLIELAGELRGYYLDLMSWEIYSMKGGSLFLMKKYFLKSGGIFYMLSVKGDKVRYSFAQILKGNIERINQRLREAA